MQSGETKNWENYVILCENYAVYFTKHGNCTRLGTWDWEKDPDPVTLSQKSEMSFKVSRG